MSWWSDWRRCPRLERSTVPGIKPARADLILAGAIVVQGVLRAGGFDGLEVTEAGLREGVFFERLLADRDPPAVRGPASRERAEHGGPVPRDAAHTEHVADARARHVRRARRAAACTRAIRVERELLWAACMLHDIGMSVDYDDHHKHSRYLILNGGLPGYSPIEIAIIAQAARYHRKGMPEPGPLAALFGRGRRRAAGSLRGVAAPRRGSRALPRPARARGTQLIDARRTARDAEGEIELRLIADGESAVPRWAAGRERELFARAFHRELSVAACER